ncbi:MAG: peptide chain release factor N(5)-glutamine methyltransferase [Methylocystaceae bacterium]|nr:peptide chain release factor N(5)-glutamine methyltransferase [Methylocystaceae bacterium]
MHSIASILDLCMTRLQKAGIDNVRFEARLLMCHVLKVDTSILVAYPERDVSSEDFVQIENLLQRREQREPLSQILGEREFWSLPFKVNRHTLTPRPDSETLIEAVLTHVPDVAQKLSVLDLGVGSGCLLLSILSEYKNATGLGVDISPAALDVALQNAQNLGLAARCHFQQGNWAEGIGGPFDLILSNPPYIPLRDKETLDPEVKDYEPATALFSGEDGLEDYRCLAEVLPQLLNSDGLAVLEQGIGQALDVAEIMRNHGLMVIDQPKDLAGVERCTVIRKKL